MSVQVSYKKQFMLSIILLLIILFAVEGLLRIHDYYFQTCTPMKSEIYQELDHYEQKQVCNDYRHVVSTGGINFEYYPNQHSNTVNINNFGMRGVDITKEKPNDTYRIFMIGGSTLFGSGATSDTKTIPGFLQEKIRNSEITQKIEIINAGTEGTTTVEETIRIKNKLIDFNPDMFIIYNGWNDMRADWERYSDNSKMKIAIQKKILYAFQVILPGYRTPINAVYFIEFITGKNEDHNSEMINFDHVNERSSLWVNRIKEVCELGYEKDFKTIVILQPHLGSSNKKMTSWEQIKFNSVIGEENVKKYDEFANGITDLQDHCYQVEDFRNTFHNVSEHVYFDDIHFSDHGNEIVAEKILKVLEPTFLS